GGPLDEGVVGEARVDDLAADRAEAIDHLLTACAGQGVTRAQVGAHDVLMALDGISLIADTERRPDLAAKLIDLLLHGILTD
ncbi:hypothetical protein ABT113_50715, partial [Streptomyces mirabilis]